MDQGEVRSRAEAVTGWRYWQVDPDAGAPLRSLSQRGYAWPPRVVLVARCADGQPHVAPALRCGCGIHASADLASLQAQALCLRPGGLVVGKVALWGPVISEERPDGGSGDHRGRFAVPLRLSVVRGTVAGSALDRVVERLGAYAVPVGVVSLEDAVGEASATILRFLTLSASTAG